MFWLFMLQGLVPALLVLLLAYWPLRGRPRYLLQASATLVACLALLLVGVWTFPPWWYPHAWLLLGCGIVVHHWRKPCRRTAVARTSWSLVLASAGYGALLLLAAWQISLAVRGRSPRAEELVELAFPLEPGLYLIVNGGSTPAINAHLKTLDPDVPGFRRWRGQSFGVDIVAIDPLGLRASGIQPRAPRAYRSYGVKVLAPCNGTIVYVVDNLPDQIVPQVDRNHMAGNYLVLRCGAHDVVLGHLQAGSMQVAAGQQVSAGQALAAVGNTGNSDEPHLHIHAQMPGSPAAPLSATPLQITLAGSFLTRNQRVDTR